MHICHIIEAAGGGSGQVVVDLAREGLAVGDDITVIYAANRATPSFLGALSSMPGLKLVETSMRREVGVHDFTDAWRLYRRLHQMRPLDVIHGHSSKAGALARISGLFFPKALKVYTPHAFVTMSPEGGRFYGFIEKILSRCCDAIIAVSEFEKEHALKHIGIDKAKVAVVLNGVKSDGFSGRLVARRELGYQDNEFVLGYVGRLWPQKNPLRLIEAFAHAHFLTQRQGLDLRLAIVGDGPLRAVIEKTIIERGLTGSVRCFGDKNSRDIIAGFDGLLCSSDYEGFPIVFLEALASAVPIVTTPVGGAREAVVEGQTGFIADGFSAASLALALLKLIVLDPKERMLMTEQIREHAQLFRIEAIAAQTRILYQRFAAGKEKRNKNN